MLSTRRKLTLNFLALVLLSAVARLYRLEVSWIEWPVSYFLSLFIMSSLLIVVLEERRSAVFLTASSLIFAIAHWVGTGALEIVLSRFFRLKEQYSFYQFSSYLGDHQLILLDGLCWWATYSALLYFLRMSSKTKGLQQQNTQLINERKAADLLALNNEISPHFLFNAMNAIVMKIRLEQNKTAVSMIIALNALLRKVLTSSGEELISLKEEIELLQHYLLVENERFGEYLKLTMHFPADVLLLKVPRLILQPLVENAFKHHTEEGPLYVRLDGSVQDTTLTLSVFNAHASIAAINYAKSNKGLPNVAMRLRHLYGTNFQFRSHSNAKGVLFQIAIPASTIK